MAPTIAITRSFHIANPLNIYIDKTANAIYPKHPSNDFFLYNLCLPNSFPTKQAETSPVVAMTANIIGIVYAGIKYAIIVFIKKPTIRQLVDPRLSSLLFFLSTSFFNNPVYFNISAVINPNIGYTII